MANENTFMLIDIEEVISHYKMGLINSNKCLREIQSVVDGVDFGDKATITFDEPTSVFGANGGSTGDVVDTTYKITRV